MSLTPDKLTGGMAYLQTRRTYTEDGYLCEPGLTIRQAYKMAALRCVDARYTNCGNEAANAYEISRFAGLLADVMLAEDQEHAKKGTP